MKTSQMDRGRHIRVVDVDCLVRVAKMISTLLCATTLVACDEWAEARFYKFCEESIQSLSAEKVSTKGIEFRGDFYLSGVVSWERFAEFVEFSKKDIGSQSPSYSEFKIPRLLKHPKYRMKFFDSWVPKCRGYWILREAPESLDEAFFDRQKTFMEKTPGARCQGIFPVEEFEAEHIVERIDNPDYARVAGRDVYARIFRVTERASGRQVGELRAYYIKSHPWFQGFAEAPQGYQCTSIEGKSRINARDLEAIFAPIE